MSDLVARRQALQADRHAELELRLRRLLAPLAGDVHELLRGVDADDLADERGERVREGTGAAADVERALVAAQRGPQALHHGDEGVVPLGLELPAVLDPVHHPTTSRVDRSPDVRIPHASS